MGGWVHHKNQKNLNYSFFNLGARWKVVNATPRWIYPPKRPGTHCIGGWVRYKKTENGEWPAITKLCQKTQTLTGHTVPLAARQRMRCYNNVQFSGAEMKQWPASKWRIQQAETQITNNGPKAFCSTSYTFYSALSHYSLLTVCVGQHPTCFTYQTVRPSNPAPHTHLLAQNSNKRTFLVLFLVTVGPPLQDNLTDRC
jgi:hypothetical protein